MAHSGTVRRRARLRGWLRYTPFLFLPFAVLGAETWLHHARIQNDYETGAMRRELRQISARVDELKDEVAQLERLDRMQSKAPDLGLVMPTPTQVRVVHLRRPNADQPGSVAIELAQLDIISEELMVSNTLVD